MGPPARPTCSQLVLPVTLVLMILLDAPEVGCTNTAWAPLHHHRSMTEHVPYQRAWCAWVRAATLHEMLTYTFIVPQGAAAGRQLHGRIRRSRARPQPSGGPATAAGPSASPSSTYWADLLMQRYLNNTELVSPCGDIGVAQASGRLQRQQQWRQHRQQWPHHLTCMQDNFTSSPPPRAVHDLCVLTLTSCHVFSYSR